MRAGPAVRGSSPRYVSFTDVRTRASRPPSCVDDLTCSADDSNWNVFLVSVLNLQNNSHKDGRQQEEPRKLLVQPVLTAALDGSIGIKQFEPTPAGMIESFVARVPAEDDALLALADKDQPHVLD